MQLATESGILFFAAVIILYVDNLLTEYERKSKVMQFQSK